MHWMPCRSTRKSDTRALEGVHNFVRYRHVWKILGLRSSARLQKINSELLEYDFHNSYQKTDVDTKAQLNSCESNVVNKADHIAVVQMRHLNNNFLKEFACFLDSFNLYFLSHPQISKMPTSHSHHVTISRDGRFLFHLPPEVE
jgi:hypothetical protein